MKFKVKLGWPFVLAFFSTIINVMLLLTRPTQSVAEKVPMETVMTSHTTSTPTGTSLDWRTLRTKIPETDTAPLEAAKNATAGNKPFENFPYQIPWNLLKRHPNLRHGVCIETTSGAGGLQLGWTEIALGISSLQSGKIAPFLTAAFAEIRSLEQSATRLETPSKVTIDPITTGYADVMSNLKSALSGILPQDKAAALMDLLQQDIYLGNYSHPRALEMIVEDGHPWLKCSSLEFPWMDATGNSATEVWIKLDQKPSEKSRADRIWMPLNGRYRDLLAFIGAAGYAPRRLTAQ